MNIYFENKNINKKIFNKFKEIIHYLILDKSRYLDFDFNLKVTFQKADKERKEVFGGVVKKDDFYNLLINDSAFESYENGYIDGLEVIVYHEFAHIYDIHNISQNKYMKYKPYEGEINCLDEVLINLGYKVWTEFFAYYKTFENDLLGGDSALTFSELVNNYKKLHIEYKKILDSIEKGEKLSKITKSADHLYDLIQEFIYELSRYIASVPFRKNKLEYCEKTKNQKAFKNVSFLVRRTGELLSSMTHGTYGKNMEGRLKKIGRLLLDTVYEDLNFYYREENGKLNYVYAVSKE